MSGRFAVSDVTVEVDEEESGGQGDTNSLGHRPGPGPRGTSPPPEAKPEEQVKMDYLTVNTPSANIERNQLTVTSVASGNLALYEVAIAITIDTAI